MTQYNHKEAFCVMQYRCQVCRFLEILWNSRDGVTPFVISCVACTTGYMQHINWREDTSISIEKLMSNTHLGLRPSRVFIDMTPERAEYLADKFFREQGEELIKQYQHLQAIGEKELHARKVQEIYNGGNAPDITTFADYLMSIRKPFLNNTRSG